VARLGIGVGPPTGGDDALLADGPAPGLASASREAGAVSPGFDSEELAFAFVGFNFFSQLKMRKKLNRTITLENMIFFLSLWPRNEGTRLEGSYYSLQNMSSSFSSSG
jgi:hypothetical protein